MNLTEISFSSAARGYLLVGNYHDRPAVRAGIRRTGVDAISALTYSPIVADMSKPFDSGPELPDACMEHIGQLWGKGSPRERDRAQAFIARFCRVAIDVQHQRDLCNSDRLFWRHWTVAGVRDAARDEKRKLRARTKKAAPQRQSMLMAGGRYCVGRDGVVCGVDEGPPDSDYKPR